MNIDFSCENAEIKSHSDRKRVLQVSCTNIDYEDIAAQIISKKGLGFIVNLIGKENLINYLKNTENGINY